MNKLDGIKEGDRVRIVFEGTVVDFDSSMKVCVQPDNQEGYSWILSDGVTNAHTFQIERIEPPVQVGDMVTWGTGQYSFELVAIRGEYGIVFQLGSGSDCRIMSDLRRVNP